MDKSGYQEIRTSGYQEGKRYMNGRNEENLKGLFERFLDSKQAGDAAKDIQKAEQILSDNPAPRPNDTLLADIKIRISRALVRRKVNVFRRRIYRMAAVAAAVIILAVMSVKLFEKSGGEPQRVVTASAIPAAIWESDDFVEDDNDAEIAILAAEIEQIESELLALRLGENGGNGDIGVTELEMELIETNSDFWKG